MKPNMSLISVQNLQYKTNDKELFSDISFSLNEHSRIGVSGHNGCGKSTFLKIIKGILSPDEGKITYRRGLRTYLIDLHFPKKFESSTSFDYIAHFCLDYVDKESTGYMVENILNTCCIPPKDFFKPISTLSGGVKSRLQLGSAISYQPDVLLLDEPTNHMDSESVILVEDIITSYIKSAYLIVSHDRALLNSCTDETLFLNNSSMHTFKGGYSEAVKGYNDYKISESLKRDTELKEIDRLQKSAKRLAQWGRTYDNEKLSAKAKSIEKKVEKLSDTLTEVDPIDKRNLTVSEGDIKSKYCVRSESAIISPAKGIDLFTLKDFNLKNGDRAVVLGINGAGKTTFINSIWFEYSNKISNDFKISPQVNMGYFDQLHSNLPPDSSIFQYLRDDLDNISDVKIKAELISAGFPFEEHSKTISILSGGEKSRLKLLQLKLEEPNLILLDEPTNHIDIKGCEVLEEELKSKNITCIIVSHDRDFIENVATRLFLIDNNKMIEINSADEYYEKVKLSYKNLQNSFLDKSADDSENKKQNSENLKIEFEIQKTEKQLEVEFNRTLKKKRPETITVLESKLADLYEKL